MKSIFAFILFLISGLTQAQSTNDSLFLLAVQDNDFIKLKELIDEGINIDQFDKEGESGLFKAVKSKNPEMVEFLLQNEANPNLQMKSGLLATALMWSTSQKNTHISKLLIDSGADVNIIDLNKDPALNWASYYGNVEQMELLIKSGADLSLQSIHGDAVDVTLRLWHADSVVSVFKETELATRLDKSTKELIHAIELRSEDKIKQAIKAGANVDSQNELGVPILQLAAQEGLRGITKLLLEEGADPNQLNRVGQTSLAYSARFGHLEIVQMLLKYGANPNQVGKEYGLTPLIGAAINGNVSIGKLLINNGATIDHVDVVNESAALHWALFYENITFAKLLINNGAELDIKVLNGSEDALSLAVFIGNNELITLIKAKKKEKNQLLGSWKFKEIHYIQKDTTYSIEEAQPGVFVVTPKRYVIMYNPYDQSRTPFKVLSKPSDDEIKHAFQTLVFNSGVYEFSDSTLSTTSTIARVPGFEGGKQYFRYEIKGDQLSLTMFDETYPNGNKPDWYKKLEILFILTKE